jgi:hypothetical protein
MVVGRHCLRGTEACLRLIDYLPVDRLQGIRRMMIDI